jgi:hypothetical protein
MDAAFAAPLLSPSRLSQPVFVDHDGDGVLDPEESAFLSASPGVVREGDAHLGKWSSALRVCPGDGDFGRATTPLQAAWGFLDASGDGMSPNDTVVLDADGSGTLTRGDLPLRSAPVAEGDPRAGLALLPLDARVAHWDHGGAERDADLLYLDRGATGHAGPGDIRLWPRSFGQPLTGWRDESLPALAVLPGLPTVPSFAGERAYLAHGASVVPGDVRLTRSADGEPGTAVLADDADVGLALARAGGAWAFLDSDHDGRYGAHDAAHLDADRSGTASAGDLVVSGPQAGQRLDASAVPVPLVPFDAAPAALDGDGDGAFSGRDLVVLDAAGPGEGLLTAADVRLSASRLQEEPRVTDPYPSSPRTCASPPEASATSPPPGPSSSASSSAPAVPSSGPEGTAAPPHSAPAPALPWAPLAAAVALAAALRRRR